MMNIYMAKLTRRISIFITVLVMYITDKKQNNHKTSGQIAQCLRKMRSLFILQ